MKRLLNRGREGKIAQRPECRQLIKQQVNHLQNERCEELDKKRDEARPILASPYNYIVDGVLSCPKCARTFINKVGYTSHQRAHHREAQRDPHLQHYSKVLVVAVVESSQNTSSSSLSIFI
ncbi:unnamed protein product, partial [Brenthis ino]